MMAFVLRWVFILIVLANAILFLWYALQSRGYNLEQIVTDGVERILLLSELEDPEPRTGSMLKQTPAAEICFIADGISQRGDATLLVDYLDGYKIRSEVEQYGVETQLGYEVIAPAPDDAKKRLEFLQLLDELELVPESRRLADGSLIFVLLRTESNALAAESIAIWGELISSLELRSLTRDEAAYRVSITLPETHELASSLGTQIAKGFPLIKISKKLCERVAKPKGAL